MGKNTSRNQAAERTQGHSTNALWDKQTCMNVTICMNVEKPIQWLGITLFCIGSKSQANIYNVV